MYSERLRETVPRVREAIAEAARAAGRDPGEVTLVAVTKGHPVEAVRAALDAGLVDLGENRVGELEEKVGLVGREGVRWHMIGHLQRRKAPRAVELAHRIQSVDSLRLAERIARVAAERAPVDVLLQVNASGEESKGGFDAADPGCLEALERAAGLEELRVGGLMTMAPFTDDESVLRATFSTLRETLARLRERRPDVGTTLSMGMTNDLRAAVAEGSTMVRVGTALFGARATGPVPTLD